MQVSLADEFGGAVCDSVRERLVFGGYDAVDTADFLRECAFEYTAPCDCRSNDAFKLTKKEMLVQIR